MQSTDFDTMVWRYIRDCGGWHTRSEIARALALDTAGKMRLAHTIRRLQKGCHIVDRLTRTGQPSFGVTAFCWPLPGETLTPDDALPLEEQ